MWPALIFYYNFSIGLNINVSTLIIIMRLSVDY